jgi:carbon storage regulator
LTRNIGERVIIGHDIAVEVLAVNGTQVRIGFVAPPGVVVNREELYRKRYGEPRIRARAANGNKLR